MPLKSLTTAKKKTVGTKQTLKAIEKGTARTVYVAEDADPRVTQSLITAAREKAIPVVYADTMKSLGKACGIEVGCASAAVLEE